MPKSVFRIHDILGWIWIRIRGSRPLTNGSGFGSGSCYFGHWPSKCQQKTNFNTIFSAYFFLKVHLHHFSKIKSRKESQNRRNQGFSYYFWMMREGSGFGSIPLTSGSGSEAGRPKNMWIRWIRIRIRIRNTGQNTRIRFRKDPNPDLQTPWGIYGSGKILQSDRMLIHNTGVMDSERFICRIWRFRWFRIESRRMITGIILKVDIWEVQ